MNVSFSTRGWQQIPWEQQVQMAETMRFGGIELYNVHKTPELTGRGGPLHRYTAAATARELWQKGLCIPCFDTACDIAGEDCTETVTALMQLAHDVQCPYVSVTAQRDDDARISAALEALLPAAEAQGITILLKTSGVFSDTARLRTLLDAFACDQLGALWDMHHPYRDHGESADTTIKNLGAYVRHVHLRDSDDDGSYDLIGEGTLPVGSMMQALSSIDYDGFISLEWKPEWMPDLTDPEVIFPHFVNYMHRFDSPRGKKKTLYDNAAHTGKFVWKKDSLISETFPQVLDRMVEEFPDQYAFKYTTTRGPTRSSATMWTILPARSSRSACAGAARSPSGPRTCPRGSSPSGPRRKSAPCSSRSTRRTRSTRRNICCGSPTRTRSS